MTQDKASLEDTLAIMRDLRVRCDWDAAQTHDSLRPYLIEESHEVDDALRRGDDRALREELGDLLLQILFHSVLAEERGAFDMHDVAHGLVTKMRSRHPHLYEGAEKIPWEQMKAKKRSSLGEGLPLTLPALHRAHRLQDRAAGVGFDWPDASGPAAKVAEELQEVTEELAGPHAHHRLEDELGDLLFACVNLCRKAGVHAALALDRANAKFERRVAAIQTVATDRGITLADSSPAVLDELWEEVKRQRVTE
ncbi:MAG TPA: nucleoside triphosphate pyrophosphohydrolase [Gemmatimonadaceae bacterium]|nr:nucleoside triphosphate pyrophosphohydrolase [Gemmatimonadaceae bacterium]